MDSISAMRSTLASSSSASFQISRARSFGFIFDQGPVSKAVRAAVLSSLFFAALHLSVPAVLPLFAFALFLCAVWRRWGLAASFGAHAGFNAANVAFALLFGSAA